MQETIATRFIPIWKLHGYLFIPIAILSGFSLGVIARLWMRWITTTPEFTWGGTLGIIFSFAIFSMTQGFLFLAHRNHKSKSKVRLFRIIALFFTLPLFSAAGAIMLPAVLPGSLAQWRGSWPKWLRVLLGVAAIVWAAGVAQQYIIKSFGWTLESVLQITVFVLIYMIVIRITKGAIASRSEFI